jgi:hypothetical protein
MTGRRLYGPIEPVTLQNMRDNGVRSLAVSCWQCHPRRIDVMAMLVACGLLRCDTLVEGSTE